MKATQRGALTFAAILGVLFAIGIAIRAQTVNQLTADDPLQPIAASDMPATATTFFLLSDYLDNGGTLGPPWPFLKDTNATAYSMDGNGMLFLVDNTAATMTNDEAVVNALTLLLQPQDEFSTRLMTANSIDPGSGDTNSSGTWTNSAQWSALVIDTNGLWIEVPSNALATSGGYNINLRNTLEQEFYDILTTTNLSLPLTNWTDEQTVFGLAGGITPAQLVLNGRSNLFVTARFDGSSDGSGLPDWWQLRYFGQTGVDPYALDSSGDGWNYEQDYLHGFVPGSFNTPPPVQNLQAHLNSSGNAVVTWQSAPGAVTNYTIYRYDDYLGTSGSINNGLNSQFVDTSFVSYPPTVFPITYYVVANYASGDSSFSEGVSPYSLLVNEQPNAQIYLGSDGTLKLAVSSIPDDADELEVIRVDWNPYDYGWGVVSSTTNFTVSVSAFTNGPYTVPFGYNATGPDGSTWYVRAVRANGSKTDAVQAGYVSAVGQFAATPTAFNDASTVLVQNAIFQIRAAGLTGPFQYSYNGLSVAFPTNYVVANLYDVYSGTLDGAGWGSYLSWTTPFILNYRYRNFAPSLTGIFNAGVSFSGAEILALNEPCTYHFASTNTIALPGVLASGDTTWIAPHSIPAALGISDSGSQFSITSNITNYFGMRLLSVLAVYSNATSGLHVDIIDSTHPLAHGTNTYFFYAQFEQPQLQTVGFYFNKTADDYRSDPAPGNTDFSTTNLQTYLIFGSPQSAGGSFGAPIEISAYSKQIIVNGDTNKSVFISQYFDKAYKVDTNGNQTTEETGILSPYGSFLPSEPGKVALVTKPDQNGQRGTGIVQIVSFQFDVNHDGKMDLSYYGPDASWQTLPYYAPGPIDFWVNDNFDRFHEVDCGLTSCDSDEDDLKFAGVPGAENVIVPDYAYGTDVPFVGIIPSIPCKKDLEDYARLWIPGLTSMIASLPTNYTVQLSVSWYAAGKLRIFQAVEPNGGTNYLFDDSTASNQVARSSALYIGVVSNGTPVILSGRTNLTDYFIMCGAAVGDADLHLTVLDQNGGSVMDTAIFFNLKEIIDMYERWTVGERPGYAPANYPQIAVDGFPDYWNRSVPFEYGENTDTNTPYILFVHGWNMETWEKDRFADTAFKRLYWLGYKGRFGLFRWPTDFNFGANFSELTFDRRNYDNSEFNAWKSGEGLENLLEKLNAQYPGHVYMLAHSMGNVVAGEALRLAGTNQVVNTYIASQAAVPAHTYDSNVTASLFTSGPPPITPNIYNNWFATNSGAVGRRINFYNTNDYALQSGRWEFNQRVKPDVSLFLASYYFSGYPYTDFSARYTPGSVDDNFPWLLFYKNTFPGSVTFNLLGSVRDRYEVMSYAAQARSTALGRTANVLNLRNVDLAALDNPIWPTDPSSHNYGDHKWHSAEFRSNLMEQQNYWRTLLYSAQDGFGFTRP